MIKHEIEKLYKKYDNIRKHTNIIEKVPDVFSKTMHFGQTIIKTFVWKITISKLYKNWAIKENFGFLSILTDRVAIYRSKTKIIGKKEKNK